MLEEHLLKLLFGYEAPVSNQSRPGRFQVTVVLLGIGQSREENLPKARFDTIRTYQDIARSGRFAIEMKSYRP